MTLDEFNDLPQPRVVELLISCCHCQEWAEKLADRRPFSDMDDLIESSDAIWRIADEAQILEAFSGHPRIGDIELLRTRFAPKANEEQGQVLAANDETIQELKRLNDLYYEKNGFIFIVCATGKSAAEMLSILQERIQNRRELELQNGTWEQGAITRLRLRKMLEAEELNA